MRAKKWLVPSSNRSKGNLQAVKLHGGTARYAERLVAAELLFLRRVGCQALKPPGINQPVKGHAPP